MWVYQETETNAAALVPTLPEDTAGESVAEKEAMTPVSKPLAELPPQKAPRRKPFQASRDCILLAAAYLFGTLMAGVLQALCDAEEMETLAYYLDCWRGVFAASSAAQAVELFGAELAVVLGAAAVFLLLGLSAVGPLPIFPHLTSSASAVRAKLTSTAIAASGFTRKAVVAAPRPPVSSWEEKTTVREQPRGLSFKSSRAWRIPCTPSRMP